MPLACCCVCCVGNCLCRPATIFDLFVADDKCNAHLSCSSRLPSTLASDAEKRVVNRAAARSVNAVPDSLLIPPCSFATVYICEKLGGLEVAVYIVMNPTLCL
jgi:hypothetical protein